MSDEVKDPTPQPELTIYEKLQREYAERCAELGNLSYLLKLKNEEVETMEKKFVEMIEKLKEINLAGKKLQDEQKQKEDEINHAGA